MIDDATGQTIRWNVFDLNPDNYVFEVDGHEFDTGSWTSGVLSLNVDDIDEGEHTLVITIYDVDGNYASDTVLVRVIKDSDAPTIQAANDITYIEGSTENVLVWHAADQYPDSYEISFNGTMVKDGSWGGSSIVCNVDGLSPGTYEYTLRVYDKSGNSATSSANVTVIPIVPTEQPIVTDWLLIVIIGAIAGGVIVLVGVIYYIRKNRMV